MEPPDTPPIGPRESTSVRRRKSLIPTATRSTLRVLRAGVEGASLHPAGAGEAAQAVAAHDAVAAPLLRTAFVELSAAELSDCPPAPPSTPPASGAGAPSGVHEELPAQDEQGDDLPSAADQEGCDVPSLAALALSVAPRAAVALDPAPTPDEPVPGPPPGAADTRPDARSSAARPQRRTDAPDQTLSTTAEALLSLFDDLEGLLYVADPDSYELLFASRGLQERFGATRGKCHVVLQGRDEPCPFCTNTLIFDPEAAGEPYVWEWRNERDGRWYRCVDRVIRWPDGRRVRAELAIDISADKRTEQEVARRLSLRRASTRLVARLVGQREQDEVLPVVLEDLGVALDAARASLILISADGMSLDKRHEWCAPGVTPQLSFVRGIPLSALSWSIDQLSQGAPITLADVRELPDGAVGERRILGSQDIRALLAVPLFGPRGLLGFVSADDVRGPRRWTNDEVGLLEVAAGALSAFLLRRQADEALRASEASYRQIVQDVPLGILRFERDGHISYLNPPLLKILGSPSATATRSINLLRFAPMRAAGITPNLERCLKTGEGGVYESHYRSAWGKQVHLRYHVRALRDERGEVIGGLALVEDLRTTSESGE